MDASAHRAVTERFLASTPGGIDSVLFVTVEDDLITALRGIHIPERLGAV